MMYRLGIVAAVAALGLSSGALADVKSGVDAWSQGDYNKAVAEWRPLANAGDPDAQFNLGQAYKLGRGVPADSAAALDWFRKAAAQGHFRAEDNYGLLLFQQGQRAEAMSYIQKSAARGEPRAQYILGTALFNGEFAGKDWVRAYALMTRASAAGLQPASTSLQQMDQHIPDEQRKKGLALAAELEKQEKTALLAATQPATISPGPVIRDAPRPVKTAELPPSDLSRPIPPIDTKPVVISVKPPSAPAPRPAPKPEPAPAPAPSTKPAPAPAVAAPAPGGQWRVQLGAFSEEGRARSLWNTLSGKVKGLSAYQPYLVKGGAVTRLQAGPLASAAEADKLCRAVKSAGTDCIPKKL